MSHNAEYYFLLFFFFKVNINATKITFHWYRIEAWIKGIVFHIIIKNNFRVNCIRTLSMTIIFPGELEKDS